MHEKTIQKLLDYLEKYIVRLNESNDKNEDHVKV